MTSICVIGIYVNNIDKAKEFYCDKLGFEIVNTYDDGCIVQLKNEGPTLILEQVDKPSKAEYPGFSQVVLGIETDNIEVTAKELKKKGVEFLYPEPRPFVAGLFMVMKDPAGNILELLQFKK